jgi:hypothetical protein
MLRSAGDRPAGKVKVMDDEADIRSLIGAHFEPMRWSPGADPDWDLFREDFLPEAVLVGAARPAIVRSLEGFISRMDDVARANLRSFEEHTRQMKILRFGNLAVVLAVSELLENAADISHDVSGFLLVKSGGRWMIAAHAWDRRGDDDPIPEDLR